MQTLLLNDILYGKEVIHSPVLIELIDAAPMQRLKRITQYGIPTEYYFTHNFTRYEHSIGTMILLKRLGATEEEQIAGLLHDASHTAFSHVIDWVVGRTEKEDYQDSMHKNVITGPAIATILQKYGYQPERIAHYENFTLLERPVPDLCADRADYGMREFPHDAVASSLAALTAHNGSIIFTNIEAAQRFAREYLKVQEGLWSNEESAIRYMFFAKMLKIAMKKKIIQFADFWTDDEAIIEKIHATGEKDTMEILRIMKHTPLLKELPMSDKIVPKKFRYIDPEILMKNKRIRLTSIDEDYMHEVERARQDNTKGVPIPQMLRMHRKS